MANPWTGEVTVSINGEQQCCKLTLGALVGLEDALGEGSLIDLARRFETGRFSSRDVMSVIAAGLRGGGWTGQSSDLMTAEIEDGPVGAARVAALLLARAFALPE